MRWGDLKIVLTNKEKSSCEGVKKHEEMGRTIKGNELRKCGWKWEVGQDGEPFCKRKGRFIKISIFRNKDMTS